MPNALVLRFSRWLEYHDTIGQLLALSERELADFGLERRYLRRHVKALLRGDPVKAISAGVDPRTGTSPVTHHEQTVQRAVLLHMR